MPPESFPNTNSVNHLNKINDVKEVEKIFKFHYSGLCRAAYRIVKDKNTAEDMVQDVFVKMWNKRQELTIHLSVKSYLYRSVINTAINATNASTAKLINLDVGDHSHYSTNHTEEAYALSETQQRIDKAIDGLPPACKTIFELSRHEELSYKEIAEVLQLSIKTVENQIGKALKILRINLKDLLPTLVLWICCLPIICKIIFGGIGVN